MALYLHSDAAQPSCRWCRRPAAVNLGVLASVMPSPCSRCLSHFCCAVSKWHGGTHPLPILSQAAERHPVHARQLCICVHEPRCAARCACGSRFLLSPSKAAANPNVLPCLIVMPLWPLLWHALAA